MRSFFFFFWGGGLGLKTYEKEVKGLGFRVIGFRASGFGIVGLFLLGLSGIRVQNFWEIRVQDSMPG